MNREHNKVHPNSIFEIYDKMHELSKEFNECKDNIDILKDDLSDENLSLSMLGEFMDKFKISKCKHRKEAIIKEIARLKRKLKDENI